MQRIVEPEIMDGEEQAIAYDTADFSGSHNRRVEVFRELAPPQAVTGHILDLGCGSGDLNFRFLSVFPECSMTGVDGSRAMIELANQRAERQPTLKGRISFMESFIPSDSLPKEEYSTIMSNSFLHHLHDPAVLWETLKQLATPQTFIFVSDLRRPSTVDEAQRTVDSLAAGEAEILKQDFFHSLCAAFEVAEVKEHLAMAHIRGLKVEALDDIHLVVHGYMSIGS